jgi:hypothetical protein
VTATLTVNTTAAAASALNRTVHRMCVAGAGVSLATLLFFCSPIRRRKWQTFFSLLVLAILAVAASGCISSSGATIYSNAGTTAGNYTITVTGINGSAMQNTSVLITVQ